MRGRGRHDYHQFHPPHFRRGRPQLLDTLVIACAILLGASALYLGAKRLLDRPEAPSPGLPGLPVLPTVAEPPTPPLDTGAASRTEVPLDSVPAIELARTGKPVRRKVDVPTP
ncbi:MAG: hypothetical protein HY924_08910 [Elusimicrobia bacterium]|nr:hypothetical protein [Elusimicrobiota bacterium]